VSDEFRFRYETGIWVVSDAKSAMVMAKALELRFNTDWKPTTSSPALVLQLIPSKGEKSAAFLVMYVFAKEKKHAHQVVK
jgi:hypothetical protein